MTVIPLCHRHHLEWHAATGFCKGWAKGKRREWSDRELEAVLKILHNREIPGEIPF
jgi:hypothetical protein